MQGKKILLLIVLASIHGSVSLFPTLPLAKVQSKKNTHHQQLLPLSKPQQAATTLSRKGSLLALSPTSIIPVIASNLQSGPFGVLALTAVTWSVVLPLTLYKKFLGIGLAYGFSILAAGYSMLQVMSSPSPHAVLMAQACIFHGARLGCYMMLRDNLRDYQVKVDDGSIPSRIAFSAGLSLFYAFLTTPVLYALRSTAETNAISLAGVMLAWIGTSLEAIADFHKLIVSQSKKDVVKEFVGPTTWTYRICRHPNYFGKVLFWTGLFFGGVTSFGASIPAWVGSTLGLLGISAVMVKSTEGLEKRQREKYAGQESFDMWRKQVKYALIPGFQ